MRRHPPHRRVLSSKPHAHAEALFIFRTASAECIIQLLSIHFGFQGRLHEETFNPGVAVKVCKDSTLKMGRLWLLPVSQLSICFLLSLLAIQQAHANSEGDALYAFKEGVKDPYHFLDSWDASFVNPCTWFHVTCNLNNNVIRLDLANASLKGPLVPQLGELIQLQYLELHNNYLNGFIPLEFGDLTKLISLDLYGNHLRGHIPATLGNLSRLKYLRLNDNNLSGSIPFSLTKVPLQVLDLSNNNLSGPIPTNGSFKSLTYESFQGNPLLCDASCTSKLSRSVITLDLFQKCAGKYSDCSKPHGNLWLSDNVSLPR